MTPMKPNEGKDSNEQRDKVSARLNKQGTQEEAAFHTQGYGIHHGE